MEYLDHIINVILSVCSGLAIFFSLILIKQRWANTLHHLMTYLLLPPISFVITKMIADNFALSLGMIGALSIVRFRNPVKNPLELVIFFGLVTLGVTFGVSRLWGIALVLVIIIILFSSKILEFILKKINILPLSLSFNEEFYGNYLEITSTQPISILENHNKLNYYSRETNDKNILQYNYKLLIRDKNEITELKKSLEQINEIVNIEVKIFNN
tara:strand:- start:568 stop:1209 length:642 start_codon:yes stop_codon:yes gene_type:complete